MPSAPVHLQVRELGLSLFRKRGHALLLVLGGEHSVEESTFETKAFGEGELRG